MKNVTVTASCPSTSLIVLRRRPSALRSPRGRTPCKTTRLLLADVYEGLKVLQRQGVREADGSPISDATLLDRARNIVAGMVGNYAIRSLDEDFASPARERATS